MMIKGWVWQLWLWAGHTWIFLWSPHWRDDVRNPCPSCLGSVHQAALAQGDRGVGEVSPGLPLSLQHQGPRLVLGI